MIKRLSREGVLMELEDLGKVMSRMTDPSDRYRYRNQLREVRWAYHQISQGSGVMPALRRLSKVVDGIEGWRINLIITAVEDGLDSAGDSWKIENDRLVFVNQTRFEQSLDWR